MNKQDKERKKKIFTSSDLPTMAFGGAAIGAIALGVGIATLEFAIPQYCHCFGR
jgi:hypothetical protein